jgi:hypothetical protein
MENLKPNRQRAKNAVTLIWIVLALEIVSFISGYFQYDLLQTVANGGEISADTATANDTREQIIAILYMIAYFISAITFILWFRRAYYNLHLKVKYLSYTEGWAAGSWFVPIANLYRPYKIMREMYLVTKEFLTKKGIGHNQAFSTNALGWWWALWIISNIFGQIVFRSSLKAETIDDLTTSTIAGMIGNIIGVPLAYITVKVIKNYSNAEPLLNEIQDETETMPPLS